VFAILLLTLAASLAGCQQPWQFHHATPPPLPPPGTSDESAEHKAMYPPPDPGPQAQGPTTGLGTVEYDPIFPGSPNMAMPSNMASPQGMSGMPGLPPGVMEGGPPGQEPLLADPLGPRPPPMDPSIQPLPPGPPPPNMTRFESLFAEEVCNVRSDFINFFSWHGLGELTIATGVAASFANTTVDQNFRNWYQNNVRSTTSDNISKVCKNFGEGGIMIPTVIGLDILGRYFDDDPTMALIGEFGDRSARAYLVGGGPLLAMQELTGAGRPTDSGQLSYWHPFKAPNGASGHAFICGVPFITAAQMSDNVFEKGIFYACSFAAGWSRINDDAHYLSEVLLGWSIAYIACESVNDTQLSNKALTVVPMVTPEMTGIGLMYQH
jgi:hypothetical protein